MLPAQPNQSLTDGMLCLQTLASSPVPLGSRELARRLGMEPTRVNRLLKTLESLGLLHQNEQRKYQSGPGMHVLAAQSLYSSGLIQCALPVLVGLRQPGFTVAMGVRWRDQVCYLYHADPGMSAEQGIGRTGLYPVTRSSIGMALLATRSDDEIRAGYAGNAILDYPDGIDSLLAAIGRIRRQGFARVIESETRSTVAVTIGTPAEAAIALAGPVTDSQLKRLVKQLQAAAQAIEEGTRH